MPFGENTAKARYLQLGVLRNAVLTRARYNAQVTIPSILPPEGQTQMMKLPETYQGFGARCVTALSSRLMTAFLPPSVPFFELAVPSNVKRKMGPDADSKDLEKALAEAERDIFAEIERSKWRAPTNIALQHLIVTGNVMEQMLPNNRIRLFRLDQYVVVRNLAGEMIEFVVCEGINEAALSASLAAIHQPTGQASQQIPLYTWGIRDEDGTWTIRQELDDQVVPDSEGVFRICPFNALRWVAMVGEDYGRAKVEEHYADFELLDGLSKALGEGAAMSSRNIVLVRPNAAGGVNLKRRLVKAANGEFLTGNPEDVEMLQFKNTNGMQSSLQYAEVLRRELAAAFLLNSSVQRDAERVTAYELRAMIEEVESVLGGVYSSLVEDIQENRLNRLVLQMKGQEKLPEWPEGVIEPTILTGLEALGREKDVHRVMTAAQGLGAFPPDAAIYVKWPKLLGKFFNGLGIPDAVNTEDEAEEIQNRRLAAEAAAQAAVQGTQQPVE